MSSRLNGVDKGKRKLLHNIMDLLVTLTLVNLHLRGVRQSQDGLP